jgi:cell fate regulator YaaT (PSP1 superfamily)
MTTHLFSSRIHSRNTLQGQTMTTLDSQSSRPIATSIPLQSPEERHDYSCNPQNREQAAKAMQNDFRSSRGFVGLVDVHLGMHRLEVIMLYLLVV